MFRRVAHLLHHMELTFCHLESRRNSLIACVLFANSGYFFDRTQLWRCVVKLVMMVPTKPSIIESDSQRPDQATKNIDKNQTKTKPSKRTRTSVYRKSNKKKVFMFYTKKFALIFSSSFSSFFFFNLIFSFFHLLR